MAQGLRQQGRWSTPIKRMRANEWGEGGSKRERRTPRTTICTSRRSSVGRDQPRDGPCPCVRRRTHRSRAIRSPVNMMVKARHSSESGRKRPAKGRWRRQSPTSQRHKPVTIVTIATRPMSASRHLHRHRRNNIARGIRWESKWEYEAFPCLSHASPCFSMPFHACPCFSMPCTTPSYFP